MEKQTTQPRPAGWSRHHADAFQEREVAAAYAYRVPYPPEVYSTLAGLLDPASDAMLDVGCGRGELARPMLAHTGRVDALDASEEMVAAGRALPDGDSPRLRWIHGRLEEVALSPPYGLATAGQSLHWMEWDVALPRLADALTDRAVLAIVDCHPLAAPWDDDLEPIIARFSTNQDYRKLDLIRELEARGLFEKQGERHIGPVPFTQPVEEVVEAYHSMSALTRVRMGEANARAFDDAVRAVFRTFAPAGVVHWQVMATIVWGRPLRGEPASPAVAHDG